MTHVASADEVLAKKVSKRMGRTVPPWKVAKLREAGLTTWPARPGKRGRPGRAPGSYGRGADEQAAQALDLIRSKVDKETAAVILYMRGWPVSLGARRRFIRKMLPTMSAALSQLIEVAVTDPDLWGREIEPSNGDSARAFRSALGPNADSVFEWITAVFAGEERAIEAPHPDIAVALSMEKWTEEDVDYEDDEFFEAAPLEEVVARARRWSEVGQELISPMVGDRIDLIASDERAWEQARALIQAMSAIERERLRLAATLPAFAKRAQMPIERVFISARRPLAVEKKLSTLMVLLLLEAFDEPSFEEALEEHERRRAQLRAISVLANDCPAKWCHKLDSIMCGEEMDEDDEIRRWLTRWVERNPDTADLVLAR
jgi:hypothetical protein